MFTLAKTAASFYYKSMSYERLAMADSTSRETYGLAEHLEPAVAVRALNHFATRQKPAGCFHSAWSHVELALNQHADLSDTDREWYLDQAQELLGEVFASQDATENTRLAALTLSSYMPCMTKRACGREITSEDCHNVYESLGKAIAYLQPQDPDDPPRWRMTETAVLAASARTGQPHLLLYPTSMREECSSVAVRNHDSYFLGDDGQKYPLQQKFVPTDKTYEPPIRLINFAPTIEKSFQCSRLAIPASKTEQVNQTLGMIVAEAAGQEISENEREFLNHLSRAVAYHRTKAEW